MQTDPTTRKLIRRKLNLAAHNINEACRLAGMDPKTITFHRLPTTVPALAPDERSHQPTRQPDDSLLDLMIRKGVGIPGDPFEAEADRRYRLASKHEAFLSSIMETKVIHHPECSRELTEGRGIFPAHCDCSPLFLARAKDGSAFSIASDGTLEKYTAPIQTPEKFRADEKGFWVEAAWDDAEWIKALISEGPMRFTTAGDGSTERFVELPSPFDTETEAS